MPAVRHSGSLMSQSNAVPGKTITSPSNARVKELVSLRKRRTRETRAVWLVEGYAELQLAVNAGVRPRSVFYCPALLRDSGELGLLVADQMRGTEIIALSQSAFERASQRESPDGWLAVVPALAHDLGVLRLTSTPLVLVCESVEKPGNLGALLRTADATGVDAVIAASPVTDWGNPNVVRASKGALFAVPIASAAAPDVRAWCSDHGLHIVAADPEADALMTEMDMTGPTAVVLGAEHDGLTDVWRSRDVMSAKLPMMGRVNSLNVAAAAAVVLYEAVRQRGAT
jgi:RNA methyltransferase, TrmH family